MAAEDGPRLGGRFEQWADALGATFGFRDITHTFELFGLCDRCADPHARTDRHGPSSSRDLTAQPCAGEDDV